MTNTYRSVLCRLRMVTTQREDAGITMVLVVGYSAVALILVALVTTITMTSLRSATNHGRFEAALSVAEAGVDSQLAAVQAANDAAPSIGDAPVPAPGHPTCPGAEVAAGASFADAAAERAWARTQLEALVAAGCAQDSGDGEYVVLKPNDRSAVYSLSAVPSFTDADATSRLVKAEYLFTPYSPTNAVLTTSNLCFSGSVDILRGVEPSADVHSNADVDCGSSGSVSSITVEGTVSASGTVTNPNLVPQLSGQPTQQVPSVHALSVYRAQAQLPELAGQWYDLCPDGTVRSPAVAPAAPVPCTGSVQATVSGTATYQGWQFDGSSGGVAQWRTTQVGNAFPGVYYVHHGDADLDPQGNPDSYPAWNATVIASAGPTARSEGDCPKVGGSIDFDGLNITNKMPGVVLYADADIDGHQQVNAGAGLFVAGDQLNLQTSSSTIVGALIAADQCNHDGDSNDIQGVTILFDGTVEAPMASLIRTALWLEYVG
jgi:hypothetical protein